MKEVMIPISKHDEAKAVSFASGWLTGFATAATIALLLRFI